MSTFKNLKGKKFGRLKVIKFTGKLKPAIWLCECECGNKKEIIGSSLITGKTKSCGCLRKELMRKKQYKHGLSDTHFYNKWLSMKRRCYEKNNIGYRRYGGRGIIVCKCWLKFENFKKDMFKSYNKHILKFGKKQTTIDRINNNGNYELSNCRWATTQEQSLNYSRNRIIEFKSKKKTLTEFAEEYNLTYSIVRQRIDKLGWSIKKALLTKQLKFYDRSSRKKIV